MSQAWYIAGRLAAGFHGDTTDLDTEILTGFLHAMHTADLERPAIARRLLWAAYRAGDKARFAATAVKPLPLPLTASIAPTLPWSHPDLLLAAAVTAGVVSLLEARIIGATRLEGRTLAEVAQAIGKSYEKVKKIRQRAEPRLVRAIQRGELTVTQLGARQSPQTVET